MKPKTPSIILFSVWLFTFLASFIAARLTPATGEGFARGLNRIGVWMGWQAAAFGVAMATLIYAIARLEPKTAPRRLCYVPAITELGLVLLIVGFIAYVNLSKPDPVTPPPAQPTTEAAVTAEPVFASPRPPEGAEVLTFSGFYKSGFESSVFYDASGGRPWWVEVSGGEWETIQSFMVERPGKGNGVTVAIAFNAWIDESQEPPKHLGDFQGVLNVVSLNSIRPISSEQFETVVSKLPDEE